MSDRSEFQEFVRKLQTAKGLEKTIPAVFGIERKEVYITKWLAYMLSADIIGADVLNAFLSLCGESKTIGHGDAVTVHAEYSFSSQKRIDILVFTDKYLIGIENKLYADEGEDQTNNYSNEMEKEAGGRKVVKIFLRPEYNKSRSGYFDNITYTQLLENIDGIDYSDEDVDQFDKMMFIEFKKYIRECLCVNYEFPRMSEKARLYHQYAEAVMKAKKEYEVFANNLRDWLKSELETQMNEKGYSIDFRSNYCQIYREEWKKIEFHFEIIWNGTFVANCENINVHVHLENFEEAEEKDVFNYFNVGSIEPKGIKSLTHKILPCDFSSENAAKDTVARILKTINSEVFQEYARMADEYLSKQ